MKISMHLEENEMATPIKIADTLISDSFLTVIELEEIAEHLLVYCNKQSIREMQLSAVSYKESED